jgi:hypothetical protein
MSFKGRLILINSVVTATATYFLTIFPASAGFIQKFDKLRRNFLWAPNEEIVAGGQVHGQLEEDLCAISLWWTGHQRSEGIQ